MIRTKDITSLSKENFRKNGIFSILIMVFAAILSAAFLALNFLLEDLFVFLVPLFVLPIMFAFQTSIIALREEENTLTFSLIFTGFKQYFNPRFSSTYSFFRGLLKILIIFVASTVTIHIAVNLIFYLTNFMGFTEMYFQIANSDLSWESLNAIYLEHEALFNTLTICTNVPSLFIVCIFGLFVYSLNSHSMFLRLSAIKYNGLILKSIFSKFLKKNKKSFIGHYLACNWPLYVLFILGFGLGGYLGSLAMFNSTFIFTGGLIGAVLLSFGIFGAKYFANKEALYTAYIPKLTKIIQGVTAEYKKQLEALKNSLGNSTLLNDIETLEEELNDTKKDSEES